MSGILCLAQSVLQYMMRVLSQATGDMCALLVSKMDGWLQGLDEGLHLHLPHRDSLCNTKNEAAIPIASDPLGLLM